MIDEMDRNPLKEIRTPRQRRCEEFKKQARIPAGWEKAETEKEFDQTVDRCLPDARRRRRSSDSESTTHAWAPSDAR